MKKFKTLFAFLLAVFLLVGSMISVSATEISGISEDAAKTASTTLSMVKQNPAPEFTVGIPASVEITESNGMGKAELKFTISKTDYDNIPETKKVSISIADAGYGNITGKFALYSADAGEEVSYLVSPTSSYYTGAYEYAIGSSIVGFDSNVPVSILENGNVSMKRYVYVKDYANVKGGTYEGYMTYNIAVIDR